ncbi:MAG: DUF2339 domain-containing protein [Erythrobacter sp.]
MNELGKLKMEFLLLLIIAGATFYLWRRSDALQLQIARLQEELDRLNLRFAPHTPIAKQDAAPQEFAWPDQPIADDGEAQPAPAPEPESVAPEELGDGPVEAEGLQQPARTVTSAQRQKLNDSAIQQQDVDAPFPEPKSPLDAFSRTGIKFDFEDFFGRLLPIWAGGIALAVGGFFLVRYSIEQGLLGPEVRVALGFLFGGFLLGGAEIAYRQEHRISDPRVRQALSGAGLATLYASFYLAGTQYELIGSTIAFLGMAGVTGAAILLSFRFGLPSAILGLVGGFAAPLLVGSENPNLPLLALYLALVTGGLTYAGNKQRRSWLALAALAGGLGWGALILFTGITGFTNLLAFGGYIIMLGAIIPAFVKTGDDAGSPASLVLRLGAAALAAIQMATMVHQAGYSMLAWGLYGLLAAGLAFLGWKEPRLREASAFAAAMAVLMLGFWTDASNANFGVMAAALAAIFAGVPLANIWRNEYRGVDPFQIAGFSLGLITVTYAQFWDVGNQPLLALAVLAIAILPALASWLLWPQSEAVLSRAGLATLASAAIGIAAAGLIATPIWAAPLVLSAVALGIIALGWKREQRGLTGLIWSAVIFAVLGLMSSRGFPHEADLLAGVPGETNVLHAVLRWSAIALPFAALALKPGGTILNRTADAIAAFFVYGIIAQIAPPVMLPWIAAGLSLAVTLWDRNRVEARLAFGLIAALWALETIAIWAAAAGWAVVAEPMLIAGEIGLREIGLYLLPLLAVMASLVLRPAEIIRDRTQAIAAIAGVLIVVIGHIVFKQIFALETIDQFASSGLAERTLWQALLFAGGFAALKQFVEPRMVQWSQWAKPAGIALIAGSAAHFGLFTFLWHNPLWSDQAVGNLPIFNLLLPAYAIAIGALITLRQTLSDSDFIPRPVFDGAIMVLVSLLALSELRHVFSGSILSDDPVGQTEDLLRSVLGIVLAIGFLMWGARAQSRSWRVGSLVLMLAAVLKVFLLDAAELDGLLRVASFVALGFSLIGIGWFYTRQLAGMKTA